MPAAQELVIFTRTYDLLSWLLPQCDRFPKSQRFVVTHRLQAAALDFQESIFDANSRSGTERLAHLRAADAQLDRLRLYLRLAHQWNWLGAGQYEHASRMVAAIGKLLGGWIRQTRAAAERAGTGIREGEGEGAGEDGATSSAPESGGLQDRRRRAGRNRDGGPSQGS